MNRNRIPYVDTARHSVELKQWIDAMETEHHLEEVHSMEFLAGLVLLGIVLTACGLVWMW